MYGSKVQYASGLDNTPALDTARIIRFHYILGALLFYTQAVDNKLLVTLSNIGQQEASATEATNDAIDQMLDYVATYTADGITFRASAMVLDGHSDAAYLNVSKASILAGNHIVLSEYVPVPRYIGPVITIFKIIKCVMSSADEPELTGLCICTKKMVPLHQSLSEIGWPQPQSPIQCNKSTSIGVANEKSFPARQIPWTCNSTGFGADTRKANFATSGLLDLTTSPTTEQNHPPIYHLYQQKIRQIALYCPRLVVFYFFVLF